MLTRLLLFAFLTLLFGCAGSDVPPPPPEAISQEQLVPTLVQIAETGHLEAETLSALSSGLEQAGLMGEAASANQMASLGDEKQVKQFAKKLSASVKRQLASGGR